MPFVPMQGTSPTGMMVNPFLNPMMQPQSLVGMNGLQMGGSAMPMNGLQMGGSTVPMYSSGMPVSGRMSPMM